MKFRSRFTEIIKKDSGMTMIELLIAFVIFGILVVAVTPVFKEGNDFWQVTQAQTELRQNLNSALQTMSTELRQAKQVNSSTDKIRFKYGDEPPEQFNEFAKIQDADGSHYIVFKKVYELSSTTDLTITSKELIDITDFDINEVNESGYKMITVTLTGEYIGRVEIAPGNRSDINQENRKLTLTTSVVPRNVQGIEGWQEN